MSPDHTWKQLQQVTQRSDLCFLGNLINYTHQFSKWKTLRVKPDWLSLQICIWLTTSLKEQLTVASINFRTVCQNRPLRQASSTPADKSHFGTEEHALSSFILQVMTEDEYRSPFHFITSVPMLTKNVWSFQMYPIVFAKAVTISQPVCRSVTAWHTIRVIQSPLFCLFDLSLQFSRRAISKSLSSRTHLPLLLVWPLS